MTADIEAEDLQIQDEIFKAVGPIDELVSIGPVQRDAKSGAITCPVILTDPSRISADSVNNAVKSVLPSVKVDVQQGDGIIFSGLCPGEESNPPPPPTEPKPDEYFMGGDACWADTSPSDWGTLALTAQFIRISDSDGNDISISNGCLSAGHVFGWQSRPGDSLSVPGHPHALRFVGALPYVGAARPVDAALASISDISHAARGAIRGFSNLQGVQAPAKGMWIAKNSAKSGVTAGLDEGSTLVHAGGVFLKGIRQTTPGFACCHDSGAAVISQDQKFLGLIFATQIAACNRRPSAFYIPARKFGDPVNPQVFDLEIDIKPW